MKRVLPPTYLLGAIAAAITLHFAAPVHTLLDLPWRWAGVVPLLAGIMLNLLADRHFKKHDTTVKPFAPSDALVTDGVFRLTRNPMYLGMVLILLGIALLLGSTSPLLAVVVLAVLLDRVFITEEERMLEEVFGDAFRSYKARVRRWC